MENNLIIIGSDETGVGDYLTPLVVAAVYVPCSNFQYFTKLGVTDSKKLSDLKVTEIFNQIKGKIKSSIRTLSQEQYNVLNKIYNANELKMLLHLEAINSLSERLETVDKIIIDQFSTTKSLEKYQQRILKLNHHLKDFVIKPQFVTNGELYHLSVATASIVARNHLLKLMAKQNQKWKMTFPLGTNKIVEQFCLEFIKKYGKNSLSKIAKLSFKTTKKILEKS